MLLNFQNKFIEKVLFATDVLIFRAEKCTEFATDVYSVQNFFLKSAFCHRCIFSTENK